MELMQIILPWPDMNLMPNRKNGRHWGKVQAAKTKARQDAYYAAKQAAGQIAINSTVALRITFYQPDNRHRDLDNLLACIKPHIDGIAKALGVDDKCFRPITVDAGYDERKQGYVMVEVDCGIS